jgi:hypothetical protein
MLQKEFMLLNNITQKHKVLKTISLKMVTNKIEMVTFSFFKQAIKVDGENQKLGLSEI